MNTTTGCYYIPLVGEYAVTFYTTVFQHTVSHQIYASATGLSDDLWVKIHYISCYRITIATIQKSVAYNQTIPNRLRIKMVTLNHDTPH